MAVELRQDSSGEMGGIFENNRSRPNLSASVIPCAIAQQKNQNKERIINKLSHKPMPNQRVLQKNG